MITAIIVNYNSGAQLTACVTSLLASSVPVRVIVSDNGSKDDSLARLEAFFGNEARLTILRNDANLGFSAGCNKGWPHVAGEYVLFINPDCVVPSFALESMYELMDARPEVGMAGCLIRNLDGSEQVGCRRYVPTPWRSMVRVLRLDHVFPNDPRFQTFNMHGTPLPAHPVGVEAISGAFMFVRRSAMEKVGALDEHYFLHCEDLDWCMRFSRAGHEILFVPDVEIIHLKGGSRASPFFVEWYKHKGMTRFYLKFFREQYSWGMMLLVILAVCVRFALISPYLLFKRRKVTAVDERAAYGRFAEVWRRNDTPIARQTVIVSGATSQIGRFLLPRLVQAGYRVVALSRQAAPGWQREFSGDIFWLKADIRDDATLMGLPSAQCLIHLAPLTILSSQVARFSSIGVKRIVAFSSSSKYSKAASPVASERAFAKRLGEAEQQLDENCRKQGVRWTVFRPTLIYGRGMDRNISLIDRIVRLIGVFPLLGEGSGLRQPVHADDLAAACVAVLDNPATFDKAYELSGGETLQYRAMVGRIFESQRHRARFVAIPQILFRLALGSMSLIPRYRDFNIAMAQRMNENLEYSHEMASLDFGYAPRKFTP